MMSTLTQTSLEAAITTIRGDGELDKQTAAGIKKQGQIDGRKIANVVITAIRSHPSMDSMETENADAILTQSSQTEATVQTLADKYDKLHSAMILLTERVSELADMQTQAQYKRNRLLDTPPKFRLPPTTHNSPKSAQQSPPTKVPQAKRLDHLTTPPPNGTPIDRAQEGQ
jgi:hypothetical protein